MPHNMGSLFWQIDDCWPVASWSSIDYTGRWKALQYYARRFYRDILLSPHAENGSLNFYIVSDRLQSTAAQLHVSLLDFEGRTLWNQQQDLEVAALNSKSYLNIPIDTLLAGKDPKRVFLFAELLVGGKPVSRNEQFFQPYKNLLLPRPLISAQAVRTPAGSRITLSSDKLARAVYLSAPNYAGFFVDNYFDLIPGRKVEVEFRGNGPVNLADFQKRLTIRSLADAF
jgi:beta-mannosidase